MPAPKSSGPEVSAVQHDDGSVSVGVKLEGVYVPLVTAAPGQVAGLIENAHNRAYIAKTGAPEEDEE